MKKLINVLAIVFIAALSTTALAGAYVGANVGQADPDASGVDAETSYTILAGYNFNEYFGVEAFYSNAGKFDINIGDFATSATVDVDGWGASLVGKYPVSDKFDVFAKVGSLAWDADYHVQGFGNESTDGTDIIWGLGAEYAITENLDVVAQFQRAKIDDTDIDNYSIGLNFNF